MISFIVPAHNEEAFVGPCLTAIARAMDGNERSYEVIVADDASTDTTSVVAEQHRARVLGAAHHQISATRNAGARASQGDILFFVDADTLVSTEVVNASLQALSEGAVGGGCVPRYDGTLPLWVRLAYPCFIAGIRLLNQPGGACLFSTREAFLAAGGFSEAHYAAEDALFVRALKRQGRFTVISQPVVTSGRNLRAHSFWEHVKLLVRFLLHGPDGFRNRSGLDIWYRPARDKMGPGM